MKVKEQFKKLNQDSTHQTIGLNVFSLLSAVLLWAHLTDHLTWWAFPITFITTFIAFGCEIQPRTKTNKTLSL